MKRSFIILLVLISAMSFAQNKSNGTKPVRIDRNYFYGNPGGIFTSTFSIAYEHAGNVNSTMFVAEGTLLNTRNASRQGVAGELHYRINLARTPKTEMTRSSYAYLYFAPYLRGSSLNVDQSSTRSPVVVTASSAKILSASGGLLFGFRASFAESRIVFGMYGGGGIRVASVDGNQEYTELFRSGYTGVVPKLGLQVGIAF